MFVIYIDQLLVYKKEYYEKNKKSFYISSRKYYEKDKEKWNKYGKEWRIKNKEKCKNDRHERYINNKLCAKLYSKSYSRKHNLGTNGKVYHGLNKRPYPENGRCELCDGKNSIKKKILVYHHWDDNNMNLGVWVCFFCHGIVESIDNIDDIEFIIKKYITLKEKI